jgi:hypothetical protein
VTPTGGLTGKRWLVSLVFPAGYVVTAGHFGASASEYLALTCVSLAGCCLLLSQLGRPVRLTLPFWLLLALFIVNYGQLYWIGADPEAVRGWWPPDLAWMSDSPQILLNAYATSTMGFLTFSLTASLLLATSGKAGPDRREPRDGVNHRRVFRIALAFLLVLIPTTSYAMYAGHIAVLGAEAPSLPFRLAGIVYYGRLITIPGLLLVTIWCADHVGSRRGLVIALVVAFIYAATDMLLRASRGSFATTLVPIGLLFLLTGRMTKARVWPFIAAAAVIVVLWPVMTLYRLSRLADDASIAVSMRQGLDALGAAHLTIPGVLMDAVRSVILRITGAVSLVPAVGAHVPPLGLGAVTSVTRFFTTEVMGFPPEAIHSSAPSLLGWFYLVGGNVFVIAGVFGLTLALWMIWSQLPRSRLRCLAVAQVLVATWILFGVAVDGVLDRAYLPALSCLASVVACEWVTRLGRARRPAALRGGAWPSHSSATTDSA